MTTHPISYPMQVPDGWTGSVIESRTPGWWVASCTYGGAKISVVSQEPLMARHLVELAAAAMQAADMEVPS